MYNLKLLLIKVYKFSVETIRSKTVSVQHLYFYAEYK